MWIAVAAAVIIALVLVVKTGTIARGLKREHLSEILNGIAKLKATGRSMEIAGPAIGAADAASVGFTTTIGVSVAWTVRRHAGRDGDVYVHHVSVSGRGPSWAFRGVMFALLLERLGLIPENAVCARSPSGVDHLRVEVPATEHEAMWARPLRPVPDQAFRVYISDLCAARDKIRRVQWDGSPFAAA